MRKSELLLKRPNNILNIQDQLKIGDKILTISEHKEEFDRLTEFCEKANISLASICLRSFPFTHSFIEQNDTIIEWKYLSRNNNLAWSIELIERYQDRWDWEHLSTNPSLPWSFELIKAYSDRWCWDDLLNNNKGIDWTEELVDKLELGEKVIEFESYHLPISNKIIERFEYKWDWKRLSKKTDLDWSVPLLRKYRQYWNWKKVIQSVELPLLKKIIIEFPEDLKRCNNDLMKKEEVLSGLPHVPEFEYIVKKNKDQFYIYEITSNKLFPWDTKNKDLEPRQRLLRYFSNNTVLPWTPEIIRSFKEKFDWESLSLNPSIPWSIELIKEFEHLICWKRLSLNTGIPWSIDLVETFKRNWYWEYLSYNPSWPLTVEFYERFKDSFIENRLFWNKRTPPFESVFTYRLLGETVDPYPGNLELMLGEYAIEDEFLEKYQDIMEWEQISRNNKLSWSKELIMKYEEKIDWRTIIQRNSVEWDVHLLEKYFEHINNQDLNIWVLRKRIMEIFIKIANEHFVKVVLRK